LKRQLDVNMVILNFAMTDINLLENQPVAWAPTPEIIERAQLTKFMRQVGVSTWDELYRYSIRDVERFTEEVIKFLGIKFDPPYDKLLDISNGIEFPQWFSRSADTGSADTLVRTGAGSADTPVRTDAASASEETPAANISGGPKITSERGSFAGGTGDADRSVRAPEHGGLNVTEMCLDRWQTGEMKDRPAVIWEGEEGQTATLTYRELLKEVEFCSRGLRASGFKKGDAIGIHLPMILDTIIALLSINRIGAIAVPVFSGYGVEAIANRLNAVEATGLFTCDGFSRRGKFFNALDVAVEAVSHCPSVRHVFVSNSTIDHLPDRVPSEKYVKFKDLISRGQDTKDDPAEPTSAEDPLIILYTSGTTGRPKGIAHTHASFPIKAAQDMAFGTDVGRGTRICWYTDIGWMMGPWLIYGALINGATICIYDGAPDHPTPDRMWEFCAKHKVEVLGISPTLVRSLAARSADTPVRMDTASASAQTVTQEKRGWYRHKLPHFDGNVTQFITFRLADSLPQGVLEQLRNQLEHDKLTEFSEEYRTKVDEYLDAGAGECILKDPAVAKLVEETILYEHGTSCDVKAWVIMPNHAHIVLRVNEGYDLANVMKRIKGISARKINRFLGRNGRVWQAD
jgi:acyl-CoA synthetase (AMP-forming)/AMP-acid ligase II